MKFLNSNQLDIELILANNSIALLIEQDCQQVNWKLQERLEIGESLPPL